MKRIWSVILAAALALGLAVTGFAEGAPAGMSEGAGIAANAGRAAGGGEVYIYWALTVRKRRRRAER